MRDSMADMRDDSRKMRTAISEMDQNMGVLTADVNHMANTVALIQHSARNLDSSIGPAAGIMNSFMPFGAGRYFGAPPAASPAPR
jgi:hypothetical protein